MHTIFVLSLQDCCRRQVHPDSHQLRVGRGKSGRTGPSMRIHEWPLSAVVLIPPLSFQFSFLGIPYAAPLNERFTYSRPALNIDECYNGTFVAHEGRPASEKAAGNETEEEEVRQPTMYQNRLLQITNHSLRWRQRVAAAGAVSPPHPIPPSLPTVSRTASS